jgi:hypothetical protein
MMKQPGCERLPIRTHLGAVPVLVPPSLAQEFQAAVWRSQREEAEFPDGREDGGVGGVWESKDYRERGRAQQEASEGVIQQRAAAGTTVL